MKETAIAHRRLGQAYFGHAQQLKEEIIAKCSTAYTDWKAARDQAYVTRYSLGGIPKRMFNPNDPRYMEASRNYRAAYAEGGKAFDIFGKAESEFKAAIRLSSNGKDLISAGTIGICMSQKPDPLLRSKARVYLSSFLKENMPANDDERTVYEYCKTELERISK